MEAKETAQTVTYPMPETPRCPNCGSTDYEISEESHWTHLRNLSRNLAKNIDDLMIETRNGRCYACGQAHVLVSPEAPVPVAPGRTISTAMVVEAGYAMTIGIPVYREQHKILCNGTEQLGTDTLSRNTHDFAMTAGKCLVNALVKKYANQYALVVDETVFKCLQSEGRGRCQTPAEEDVRSTNQILTITSVPGADDQFAFYRMLGNRSGSSIQRELEDFKPSVIVTDACASYNTVLKQREEIKHQSCMIHWRRKILKAVPLELVGTNFQGKDALAKIADRIAAGDPFYLLAIVVDGMRKLYAAEEQLTRRPNETRVEHLARIRESRAAYAAPLMANIDRLMLELAKRYACEKREGVWEKTEDSDIADAVVYYMNQREAFHYFLKDPRISPDSNAVERAVRPLTVLRKAIYSKQSIEYTQSMCIWFTLFKTARMNGIKNPQKWLTEFGNDYVKHCADRTLTAALHEGQKLSAKVIGLRPDTDQDFDCTPWLPAAYAAKLANVEE